MPTSYVSDREVEYSKVVNGVQIWDVGCERQVQITGPDTMTLAQTPRNLVKCAVGRCKCALNTDQDGGVIRAASMRRFASYRLLENDKNELP